MLVYCPRHRIGYNDDLDPVCPQCSVAKWEPPDPWPVDVNPASETYGKPLDPDGRVDPATLKSVLGRSR